MPLIKRYPNRKLYNTREKCYITLDEIGRLIRQGEEIEVTDHASGEDLTALTLSQVILEQEKRKSGSLSYSVLAGLVRSGEESLVNIQHILVSSLGLSSYIEGEIKRRVDILVENNIVDKIDADRWLEMLLKPEQFLRTPSFPDESVLARVLRLRGVPSREEVMRLSARLDEVSKVLDEIADKG